MSSIEVSGFDVNPNAVKLMVVELVSKELLENYQVLPLFKRSGIKLLIGKWIKGGAYVFSTWTISTTQKSRPAYGQP